MSSSLKIALNSDLQRTQKKNADLCTRISNINFIIQMEVILFKPVNLWKPLQILSACAEPSSIQHNKIYLDTSCSTISEIL